MGTVMLIHITVPYIGDLESNRKFATDLIPGTVSTAELQKLRSTLATARQNMDRFNAMPEARNVTLLSPGFMEALTRVVVNNSLNVTCAEDVNMNGTTAGCVAPLVSAFQEQLDLETKIAQAELILSTSEMKLKKATEMIEAIVDQVDTWLITLIVSTSLACLISLWFIYVQFLAYRKALLELALSSPSYPFHPKMQNCTKDKKLVAYITFSILLGFFLLVIIFVLCGLLCTFTWFWELIWNYYIVTLVAFCIYETIVLLVVPLIHSKAVVNKKGHLTRPAAQAAMICIWEAFYLPQSALSVALKACYCLGVSMVMFLRPDEPVLPSSWHWLDSMHASYVAAVYEHLQTGNRSFIRISREKSSEQASSPKEGEKTDECDTEL